MKKALLTLALLCMVGGCAQVNKAACWADNLWEPCETMAPAVEDDN